MRIIKIGIKLTNLYSYDKLTDPPFNNYTNFQSYDVDYVIKTMSPQQAMSYIDYNTNSSIVDQYINNPTSPEIEAITESSKNFDSNKMIVVYKNIVLDGSDHLLAGILSRNNIKYIDLSW